MPCCFAMKHAIAMVCCAMQCNATSHWLQYANVGFVMKHVIVPTCPNWTKPVACLPLESIIYSAQTMLCNATACDASSSLHCGEIYENPNEFFVSSADVPTRLIRLKEVCKVLGGSYRSGWMGKTLHCLLITSSILLLIMISSIFINTIINLLLLITISPE